MPLSTKDTKKVSSNEQATAAIETPATATKHKTNRGNIISSLFTRNKPKTKSDLKSEDFPSSLTCLYANSNASEPSSSNVSSLINEIEATDSGTSAEVLLPHLNNGPHKLEKVKENSSDSQKSKKTTFFSKLKRRSANQTSSSTDELDEGCHASKESVPYENCYAGFSECSALCCISQDIPIITVLKEVLQFGTRLQDSEYHLIQIFSKYLKDDSLERELVETVSGHAKVQIQMERRSQALASAMWKQQSDLYKSQEKTLTENLKEIVWQNRKLQEENEILMRRMDTIGVQHEESSTDKNNSGIMDRLHRSNERLRHKVSNLTQQLNELENNLLNEKNRYGTLEEQFSACFSELQTEKINAQAMKMDHQLEMETLRQHVDMKDEVIKDAIQTGDALLEEIERTKREIPTLFDSIDWQKHNNIKNPLSNIIMMSRFCLGETVNRTIDLQKELSATQSERDHFKGEVLRGQKSLESASEEITALRKQTELLNVAIQDKEDGLKRINSLERENMALEKGLRGKVLELEEIKAEKTLIVEGIHQVKDIVHAKEDEIKCVKAENETLIFQNKSLSQILMQSGSGDVARELASSQEKLQLLQSHYYQLVAHKDQLEEKLKICYNDIEVLKTANVGLTDKLTVQAQAMNELNEIKLKMKEEMGNQQATLIALQNERRRHLAEKNFLRSIYDKIQNDATKTESLEGSLSEVSKEADRLAIIAEFNKLLGERYQNEIQERDEIINELKESLKSLNNAQQVNVKEKVALCEELSEMCSIKEILANKLQMEVQKSLSITESAKETESTVSDELTALKEMQKIERSAVKELLQDFNILIAQRDKLSKHKTESEKQIEYLQEQVSKYQEEANRTAKDLADKEQAIVWLDNQLRTSDEKARSLTDRVEGALKKQISDMERLVNDNNKLILEKEKYKTSIEYLKSNVQNLQSSLDHSRKSENEYKKLFEMELEKCQSLTNELKESNEKNVVITEEIATLRQNVAQLKMEYGRLFEDHENLIKTMPEHEELLQRYKGMETLTDKYKDEVKLLKEETSRHVIKIESLEKDNQKQSDVIEKLITEGLKLRQDLSEAISDKEALSGKLILVTNELDKTKNDLIDKVNSLHEKTKSQQHCENTCIDAQRHIKDVMETLQAAEERNVKLKSKLEIMQNMYRALEETHRKLAEKLLKTVHALMDEKLARRSAENNSDQLTKMVSKIELEKNDFIQKIKSQTDTIRNQEKKFSDFEIYKNDLEEKLKEAAGNYQEILSRYDEVIREFAATEIRCKEYETKLDKYLSACPNCKNMEEKISDLKSNLDSSQDDLVHLQDTITNLKLTITSLEFQKSENQLHLHNVEKELEMERIVKEQSQEINNKVLSKTLELKEETKITKSACDILLSVVHSVP